MNLSLYISELLIKNNCVIVPNFGGFIANYQSAVVDEVRNKIYPPSKNVLFNPNLISNDGLLANYVSIKINETYSESLNLIEDKVTEWKTILDKGGRINLGEIGFLYQKEASIKFEQNREFNLLLEAYGLSSIKFISNIEVSEPIKLADELIVQEKEPEVKIIEFSPSENIKEEIKVETLVENTVVKSKSRMWKYMAVACVLPALFYSYWIPMNTSFLDTGNVQVSDFNPLNTKALKIYNTRAVKNKIDAVEPIKSWSEISENIKGDVKFYNYKFNEELYIPVKLITESTTAVLNNIHLIAGCFSNESNAKALVLDLKSKGYSAFILDQNKSLYRVSAASFISKNEAVSVKDKLSSESISTWILNK